MPSSTSSFEARSIPRQSGPILALGVVAALLVLLAVDLRLRNMGLEPAVRDSENLWAAQRSLATALGNKALIVVGSSRIQAGLDLAALRRQTGLVPVQLAIDGAPFLPVLEDLANDPQVTGTVLISGHYRKLLPREERTAADRLVHYYRNNYRGLLSPALESMLKVRVQGIWALYATDLPKLTLAEHLLLGTPPRPRYVSLSPARELSLDYSKVPRIDVYAYRTLRHLGRNLKLPANLTVARLEREARRAIELLPPHAAAATETDFGHINAQIAKLQARGVRVIVVRFPTSGLIWEIDEHVCPRKRCWERFSRSTRAETIHFRDHPELQFELADGSHLSISQKTGFTAALAKLITQTEQTRKGKEHEK